jgi:hypothetical protein
VNSDRNVPRWCCASSRYFLRCSTPAVPTLAVCRRSLHQLCEPRPARPRAPVAAGGAVGPGAARRRLDSTRRRGEVSPCPPGHGDFTSRAEAAAPEIRCDPACPFPHVSEFCGSSSLIFPSRQPNSPARHLRARRLLRTLAPKSLLLYTATLVMNYPTLVAPNVKIDLRRFALYWRFPQPGRPVRIILAYCELLLCRQNMQTNDTGQGWLFPFAPPCRQDKAGLAPARMRIIE